MFPANCVREPDGGLKIRLAGKGIVSMKDPKVKGDQYVTIQIAVPQNLTAEAKEKLREFAAACEKWAEEAGEQPLNDL